jgi:hypothetical protein
VSETTPLFVSDVWYWPDSLSVNAEQTVVYVTDGGYDRGDIISEYPFSIINNIYALNISYETSAQLTVLVSQQKLYLRGGLQLTPDQSTLLFAADTTLNEIVLFPKLVTKPLVAPAAPAASSSTGPATVVCDPLFLGFQGQRYQVRGMDSAVYGLLSQASLAINARFVFLHGGACPVLNGQQTQQLLVTSRHLLWRSVRPDRRRWPAGDIAGPAADGFRDIRIQQQSVPVSKSNTFTCHKLNVTVLSSHSIRITVKHFRLVVDNSDKFVNWLSVEVLNWHPLTVEDEPTGLLAQTWQTVRRPRRFAGSDGVMLAAQVTEVEVDDYIIAGGQLLGTEFFSANSPRHWSSQKVHQIQQCQSSWVRDVDCENALDHILQSSTDLE